MFWEEKIDRLKSKFSQEQFRVPFSDWTEIFKKMEAKFVSNKWPIYQFCNWSEKLREKTPIRNVSQQDIDKEISRLDASQNYWMFVVLADNPTSRQYVYDCNTAALRELLSIAPADFYIGHKKYEWLVFFEVSHTENSISLIKPGEIQTPFD
ncbi:hypothetical protein Q4E93_23720 [Flavitalea sp. BT771]|uniref:DUF6756 family protein n=1 Tax=Flavitalea sp. BT771 TaxID=3063329 RepID=UPI0026E38A4F|nr:DUF6756 family protein [Flavitalea sp. BT771]MDO6433640.1 hypothetical protein [Flavitalea sp. BT771]MDV6222455.1 DUF6756 family protein [Flavitalea sp. BT771]